MTDTTLQNDDQPLTRGPFGGFTATCIADELMSELIGAANEYAKLQRQKDPPSFDWSEVRETTVRNVLSQFEDPRVRQDVRDLLPPEGEIFEESDS